ncbi:MAG TPA: alpha/beta hydrolase, partial [Acidimicrobiales bacterium]|nr:alpha/beta hydrolase [Acidimicrobiales bacterium]
MELSDEGARAWLERGDFYEWRPEAGGSGDAVRVFHLEAGPADAPLLLLVHGWPTSSIDWSDVLDGLAGPFRVAALDFPGYGFSAKPRDWPYSLALDADLLEHHLVEVLGASRCRIVAHDRGDSVAMLLHHRLRQRRGQPAGQRPDGDGLRVDHLVLTNGNVFLPLSNLTGFQKLLLDEAHAPGVLGSVTPQLLAEGLGTTTFTPSRSAQDARVRTLAATFSYEDGTSVLDRTVRYLRERADDELVWLRSLAESDVPTSMVWGLCDTVSPPRVAAHVWARFLRGKDGPNTLWFVPDANHYLQND